MFCAYELSIPNPERHRGLHIILEEKNRQNGKPLVLTYLGEFLQLIYISLYLDFPAIRNIPKLSFTKTSPVYTNQLPSHGIFSQWVLPIEHSRLSKFHKQISYCVCFQTFSALRLPSSPPNKKQLIGKCSSVKTPLKVGPGSRYKWGIEITPISRVKKNHPILPLGLIISPHLFHWISGAHLVVILAHSFFLNGPKTHPHLTVSWFLIPRQKAKQFHRARGCLMNTRQRRKLQLWRKNSQKCWG